jgi:hypothetical protein
MLKVEATQHPAHQEMEIRGFAFAKRKKIIYFDIRAKQVKYQTIQNVNFGQRPCSRTRPVLKEAYLLNAGDRQTL